MTALLMVNICLSFIQLLQTNRMTKRVKSTLVRLPLFCSLLESWPFLCVIWQHPYQWKTNEDGLPVPKFQCCPQRCCEEAISSECLKCQVWMKWHYFEVEQQAMRRRDGRPSAVSSSQRLHQVHICQHFCFFRIFECYSLVWASMSAINWFIVAVLNSSLLLRLHWGAASPTFPIFF